MEPSPTSSSSPPTDGEPLTMVRWLTNRDPLHLEAGLVSSISSTLGPPDRLGILKPTPRPSKCLTKPS